MSEENKNVAKEEVGKVEVEAKDKVEAPTVVVDKPIEEVVEDKSKSKSKKSTKITAEEKAENVVVDVFEIKEEVDFICRLLLRVKNYGSK